MEQWVTSKFIRKWIGALVQNSATTQPDLQVKRNKILLGLFKTTIIKSLHCMLDYWMPWRSTKTISNSF